MSSKLRKSRDSLRDATDACRAALLELNDTLVANHEWSRRQFAEINEKLDRIMAHLDVPPKPPAGFLKE